MADQHHPRPHRPGFFAPRVFSILCCLPVLCTALLCAQPDTSLVRKWVTYLGGLGNESILAMTVDPAGHTYVTGRTTGQWVIETAGAIHQDTAAGGQTDAFLAKFTSYGALVWATYFGGPHMDEGTALALDGINRIYLIGNTLSDTLIATPNAAQPSRAGGIDVFIALFDANGALVSATYMGGSEDDLAKDATVHRNERLFICGTSTSLEFVSSTPPILPSAGGSDGFVATLGLQLTPIGYTFLGGTGSDTLVALASLDSLHLALLGNTDSASGIATAGAFQPDPAGGMDAFILRMDTALMIVSGTYFGGAEDDFGRDLVCDSGRVVICGTTWSDTLHTDTTSFSAVRAGGSDAFLAVLNDSLQLQWATFHGDTLDDHAHAVALDIRGAIYLAGSTASTDSIATTDGMPQTMLLGPWDAYVVKFDSANTKAWGTYLGGSAEDHALCLHVIGETVVMLAGWTNSPGALAYMGHQMEFGNGDTDAWLARLILKKCTPCSNIIGSGGSGGGGGGGGSGGGGSGGGGPTDQLQVCEGESVTLSVLGGALGIDAAWVWYADVCGDSANHIGSGETLTLAPASSFLACVRAESVHDTTTCTCIPIVVVPMPLVNILSQDTICTGSEILVVASGATDIVWMVNGIPISTSPSASHVPDSAGTFMLSGLADNSAGCTTQATAIVTVLASPTPVWSIQHPTCYEGSNGSILLEGSTDAGLSIVWSGMSSSDTLLTGLYQGTYFAYITSGNGCTMLDSVQLLAPPAPGLLLQVDHALCGGASGSANCIAASGTLFDWGTGYGTQSFATGLSPGYHSLSVLYGAGCTYDTVFYVPSFGAITAWTSPDTLITTDGSVLLYAGAIPYLGGNTFNWQPDAYVAYPDAQSSTAQVETTTLFTVIATSPFGCVDTAYVLVIHDPMTPCGTFFLPNVFSPNGDGLNDGFRALGGCFTAFHMNIYDRWGLLMFTTDDPDVHWDGTHRGQVVPAGTYMVSVSAERRTGERIDHAGAITLLR